MIKALIAGIWVTALLSGSVFFFGQGTGSEVATEEVEEVQIEQVKLDSMSVTIVRDNTLQGYVLIDAVFLLNMDKISTASVPVDIALKDTVNKSIFTYKDINLQYLESFEYDKFKAKVTEDLNKKYGSGFVQDMLIERIDFISYEEIRTKKLRGG